MEATDDIIDQLIGDQVDKIGNLLFRSIGGVDNDGKVLEALARKTTC
jgi:hypothetical protein